MSDPQRSQPDWDHPDATRDARIEQLLLSGLDHYFQGQYEYAISIWTRVSFLERGHSRAKAYIARARTALAERQRESEELVDAGVEAYNAGRLEAARDLLTTALERGGPNETAQLFLERLTRVVPAVAGGSTPAPTAVERPVADEWLATFALSAAIACAVGLATVSVVPWFMVGRESTNGVPGAGTVLEALPVPRTTDLILSRSRELAESGRVREALSELDAIPGSDATAVERDRLRVELQRRVMSENPSTGRSVGR